MTDDGSNPLNGGRDRELRFAALGLPDAARERHRYWVNATASAAFGGNSGLSENEAHRCVQFFVGHAHVGTTLHRFERVQVEQHPTSHQYHLTPEAAALRAEHQRILTLHRRSIKLAAAACQLKIALSTAALLSRTGQLEVDPETDSSGSRFVIRASVAGYWLHRHHRR